MKVAYLVNQYPHVSHTFIRREITALETLGLSVDRFTIRQSPNKLVDPLDQAEQSRTTGILDAGGMSLLIASVQVLFVHPIRFARAVACAWRLGQRSGQRWRTVAYLVEAAWLERQLERRNIPHLHAHFGTNSTAVALLCRHLGGPPYSFTVHGPEEFDHPQGLSLPEKTAGAAFVIAISEFGRSQLFRWCDSCQWRKIQVVRCGIDDCYFDRPPGEPIVLHRLVTVGRLCEQKGQVLLVQAAAMVRPEFPDFKLVLVGDGPKRGDVEAAIRNLGMQDAVEITGWLSNEAVQAEIEASRAFVLASFAEGLPVVLMEALALGKPAISTFIAGIPEIVRDGENGRLVPAGDVGALANAMRWILGCSLGELQKMGTKGREIVRDRHDIRRQAAKLQELFVAVSVE